MREEQENYPSKTEPVVIYGDPNKEKLNLRFGYIPGKGHYLEKMEDIQEGFSEEVWFLYGIKIFNFYFGFTVFQNKGEVAYVTFDWKKAISFLPFIKDANKFLIGFYHTHPGGDPAPSCTDTSTMGTWVKALGKGVLCGIKSGNRQKCYLYKRVAPKSSEIKYKKISSVWAGNLFCGRYTEGK